MIFVYNTEYFPPAPAIEIKLARLDESFRVGPVLALVDTGADATIIPAEYLVPLEIQADNRKYLRSQWGESRIVDTYLLDVGIGDMRFPFIEIVADALGDEPIIGRDLLNKLTLQLNGRKQTLQILE